MKVTVSKENDLKFDNGVELFGWHENFCCEHNYLDFEQLPVGTELPDMTARELHNAIKVKQDGLILKDKDGVPKWVQARSNQNGYYSSTLAFAIKDKDYSYQSGEVLQGIVKDKY